MSLMKRASMAVILLFSACVVPDDILEGLPCPCASGYTCNANSICVMQDDLPPTTHAKTCWIQDDACDWTAGNFELVPATLTVDEGEAFAFSPDGCTLYSSQRTEFTRSLDLFTSTRSPAGAFSQPQPIRHLSTSSDEKRGAERADSLELFFLRKAGRENARIYRSERASLERPWQAAAPLVDLNMAANGDLSLAPDGLTLYFSRTSSSGTKELFTSTRAQRTDTFSVAEPLPLLETRTLDVGKASLTENNTTLTFLVGNAPAEAQYAIRNTPSESWMPQGAIPGLSGLSDISELAVSADGCEVVLVSDEVPARFLFRSN